MKQTKRIYSSCAIFQNWINRLSLCFQLIIVYLASMVTLSLGGVVCDSSTSNCKTQTERYFKKHIIIMNSN